jgi:DGQHR domain-containing protein
LLLRRKLSYNFLWNLVPLILIVISLKNRRREMEKYLTAISYRWSEHLCYIGLMDYGDVESFVDIKNDLAMNREINEIRVKDIKNYIENEIDNTFFPAVILNCNASTEYSEKDFKMKFNEGKLTIIDGQHRLKAIAELLLKFKDTKMESKFKKLKLPVLIIEGLENSQHRSLFYTINKKSKTVDNNISVRFTPTVENLIGLKYFSIKPEKKKIIEWEKKQSFSKDKVAYIHIIECIKEIHKIIAEVAQKHYSKQSDLLYEEEAYFGIFSKFLDKVFEHIEITRELKMKQFFMTKIYLLAITAETCKSIESTLTASSTFNEEQIIQVIENELTDLLQEFVIPYDGLSTSTGQSVISIQNYLIVNKLLAQKKESMRKIPILIQKYVSNFYDKKGIFTLEDRSLELIQSFIQNADREVDSLINIDAEYLTITGTTTVVEIIKVQKNEELEN